jgi:hypothetical protein
MPGMKPRRRGLILIPDTWLHCRNCLFPQCVFTLLGRKTNASRRGRAYAHSGFSPSHFRVTFATPSSEPRLPQASRCRSSLVLWLGWPLRWPSKNCGVAPWMSSLWSERRLPHRGDGRAAGSNTNFSARGTPCRGPQPQESTHDQSEARSPHAAE